jgi:hypothetical protein
MMVIVGGRMPLNPVLSCWVADVALNHVTAAVSSAADESPKTQIWVETCMKDIGWQNEDGYAYCICVAGKFGISSSIKDHREKNGELTCQVELPTKEENPKRHWIADCVVNKKLSHRYCRCIADQLKGPVDLLQWKKTKAGALAHNQCEG